jgi:putative ABC transport system ATP-binding protein
MSHICTKNVCKAYHVGSNVINALQNLSVDVEAGEFAVVLGPSGSGKTTLLNLLGGLETPDSGDILVGDDSIARASDSKLTAYRRQSVGFIFQFFNLLPTLTALENVILSAEMGGGRARDSHEMLKRVGLGDRMDHYPGQLSGGQQQRVAIARALAKNPALVLADEPTGSLDVETGIEVLQVMRDINHETKQTFILVTHNTAIAQIADRVVKLGSGHVQNVTLNPAPLNPKDLNW